MIQVGKLRTWVPKGETESKAFFKPIKGMYYESLHDCFVKAEEDVKKLPKEERYNLFYTVAHHLEGQRTKKSWQAQDIIPFDLDGIDLTRIDEYQDVVAEVLGFDLYKCAVVYSGNGVHILVEVKQWSDKEYIKDARKAYIQCIDRIVGECEKRGLAITKDTTAWDYGRILRLPYTDNVKGDSVKQCELVSNNLECQDWTLPALEKVDKKDYILKGSFPRPDQDTIVKECNFFNWLEDKPDEVHEPHAYAMLSIAGHFPDDAAYARKLYDTFSSPSINSKSFDEFL